MKRFLYITITIGFILLLSSHAAYSEEKAVSPEMPASKLSVDANHVMVQYTDDGISKPQPTLQLSNDELYKLQKLRIQNELQDEIVSWFHARFWFIAFVTFLIGVFGVRALVREFVSSEIKEAMRATLRLRLPQVQQESQSKKFG